jgi:hypothetical protein
MNMFDMGMYGMMHPDERRKMLDRGSLYTAGGDQAAQNTWRSGDQSQQVGTLGKIKNWYLGGTGEKPTRRKPEGYYAKKQRELEGTYGQVGVGTGGQINLTYDKKKDDVIGATTGEGYPPGVKAPTTFKKGMTPFDPSQDGQGDKGFHNNETEQLKWWQTLANKAGIDFSKAAASWKEKGGFEGLMSNPAFTMGLAFMQAGAEGKTLGSGALDNVMKAGGISMHYKKIIEDRKQEPIQATAGDIAQTKSLLKSMNIEEENWAVKLYNRVIKGEKPELEFDMAVEEIAVKFQEKIRDEQAKLKAAGKSQTIRSTDQLRILKKLLKDNKVEMRESILSKIGLTAATIRTETPQLKVAGGPVAKGQPYVVGEGGPEYFLPQETGKVLSNDDSRIFAMLLASNPQLQQVSRTRAEKILRNRFPEYFE